jgi:hypothetical protein
MAEAEVRRPQTTYVPIAYQAQIFYMRRSTRIPTPNPPARTADAPFARSKTPWSESARD